jgi:RNase P subunit RPR2
MGKKPEVLIEQDPAGNRFLAIKCPDCGHINRYPFEGLSGDIRLECECGVGFNFTAKNYDDLMEKFGPGDEDEEKPN